MNTSQMNFGFELRKRWVFTVFLMLFLPMFVFSQSTNLVVADSFPKTLEKNTWLFHQPDRMVYHLDYLGDWDTVLHFPVDNVWLCNALVVVEYNRYVEFFAPTGGQEGSCPQRYFICKESIVGAIGFAPDIQLVDNRPYPGRNDNRRLTEFLYGNHGVPKSEIVAGIEAYCFPQNVPGHLFTMDYKELHNWGMIGVNAQWLIEPKFDAPFHFKNGTAEVLYYGQKRKINEKGEFVE